MARFLGRRIDAKLDAALRRQAMATGQAVPKRHPTTTLRPIEV